MIRVNFKVPRCHRWRNWRKRCAAARRLQTPKTEINDALYKECSDLICAAFSNKCAYCEGRLLAQSQLNVEHFRPKGGVRDLNNKKVWSRKGRLHPGYWWLAYEYRNLLPACSMCNCYSKKHGGKGERFPVGKFRARVPGEERREKPLLLCPTKHSAEKFFELDFETGALSSSEQRGTVSISVFGLNREGLLAQRRTEALSAAARLVRKKIDPLAQGHIAGTEPYSLVWRKVLSGKKKTRKRKGQRVGRKLP